MLTVTLMNIAFNLPHIQSANANRKVNRVLVLIAEDIHNGPSLSQMAREVNLSTSRLRHLFKEETGMTPTQYIRFVRMRNARELAANTFLNVKEIVSLVGGSDESHFLKAFKRVHGVTLSQYRRQCARDVATSASK